MTHPLTNGSPYQGTRHPSPAGAQVSMTASAVACLLVRDLRSAGVNVHLVPEQESLGAVGECGGFDRYAVVRARPWREVQHARNTSLACNGQEREQLVNHVGWELVSEELGLGVGVSRVPRDGPGVAGGNVVLGEVALDPRERTWPEVCLGWRCAMPATNSSTAERAADPRSRTAPKTMMLAGSRARGLAGSRARGLAESAT